MNITQSIDSTLQLIPVTERDEALARADRDAGAMLGLGLAVHRLEQERDALRKDLCEIAEGCGIGVPGTTASNAEPDQTEVKRRIIDIRVQRDDLMKKLMAAEDRLCDLTTGNA